jgi:hypothetical protein
MLSSNFFLWAVISWTQVRLSRFHTLNTQVFIYRTQVRISRFHPLNTQVFTSLTQVQLSRFHNVNTQAIISWTHARLSRFHDVNTQAIIYRTRVGLSRFHTLNSEQTSFHLQDTGSDLQVPHPEHKFDSPGSTSWTHKFLCPTNRLDSQGSTQPEQIKFRPWTQVRFSKFHNLDTRAFISLTQAGPSKPWSGYPKEYGSCSVN